MINLTEYLSANLIVESKEDEKAAFDELFQIANDITLKHFNNAIIANAIQNGCVLLRISPTKKNATTRAISAEIGWRKKTRPQYMELVKGMLDNKELFIFNDKVYGDYRVFNISLQPKSDVVGIAVCSSKLTAELALLGGGSTSSIPLTVLYHLGDSQCAAILGISHADDVANAIATYSQTAIDNERTIAAAQKQADAENGLLIVDEKTGEIYGRAPITINSKCPESIVNTLYRSACYTVKDKTQAESVLQSGFGTNGTVLHVSDYAEPFAKYLTKYVPPFRLFTDYGVDALKQHFIDEFKQFNFIVHLSVKSPVESSSSEGVWPDTADFSNKRVPAYCKIKASDGKEYIPISAYAIEFPTAKQVALQYMSGHYAHVSGTDISIILPKVQYNIDYVDLT